MAFIRNAASMMGLQVAAYIVPLFTLPYLARVLGVTEFGHLAFSFAVTTYCVLFADWGFALSASRKIAQSRDNPDELSQIFWHTMGAKTLLALVSLLVLLGLSFVFEALAERRALLLACWIVVPANVLQPSWFLQGIERMTSLAIASILGRLATIPLLLLFVHMPADVIKAGAIQASGGALGALFALRAVRRSGLIGRPVFDLRRIVAEMGASWHLFLSTAAANLYTTTNTVVLGALAGPQAVGNFSAADRIKTAANGMIMPLSQVAYPRISRLIKEDADQGLAFARRFMILQAGATLLLSIMLFLFAEPLVRLAVGQRFEEAPAIMRLLAWLPFIVGLSNVFGVQILLPFGHTQWFSRTLLCAAVISLTLIGPLTFAFGAKGAAMAVLITESFVTVTMAVLVVKAGIPLFRAKKETLT